MSKSRAYYSEIKVRPEAGLEVGNSRVAELTPKIVGPLDMELYGRLKQYEDMTFIQDKK